MPISSIADEAQAKASTKYGMQFEGDVPLSVSDVPAHKIGKRQVTKEWKQFHASLRLLSSKVATDADLQQKEINDLHGRVESLMEETRRLERVMIERGLEIVGVSAKDRQFALPAGTSD